MKYKFYEGIGNESQQIRSYNTLILVFMLFNTFLIGIRHPIIELRAKYLGKLLKIPLSSFGSLSVDSNRTKMIQQRLRQILNKNGPESSEFHKVFNEMENRLQQCVRQERIDEAIDIYRFKTNLVQQIFGKDSKKYINQLRNMAYFYQKSQYYSKAIETLQIIKDTLSKTQQCQSRWSELNINYNQGICYSQIGQYQKANTQFLIAFHMLQEINQESYHRNISEGSLYAEMGIVKVQLGKFKQGIQKLNDSINIFRKENKESIYSVDEETIAKPFIYLAKYYLEAGNISDVQGLVLEGMSYFNSDIVGHSKAALGLQAAQILMKLNKVDEANRLYSEIRLKMPLVLQPNIMIHKIIENTKIDDPDYELCEKDSEKLAQIFENLKKITQLKKKI